MSFSIVSTLGPLPGNSLLNGIAITPDSVTAYLTSFGNHVVYTVNISNPAAMVLGGPITLNNGNPATPFAIQMRGTIAWIVASDIGGTNTLTVFTIDTATNTTTPFNSLVVLSGVETVGYL